ncbi:MAG TPA: 3-methyl-2-oxobutanoate hydroxymethyltransferase [Candidatus Acidoferrales bacterium]|nr:3-methyl-2-oxobutanoate hydroxymethyltransferase [Candidatus Acidoferrales bacterium]
MIKRRLTAAAITERKGTPFPVITAYDAAFARCAQAAGIDVLMVGDSLGMVVLGYDSTVPVTLDDIERCAGAVVRGSDRAHVVADLPFGSYEAADDQAVTAALTLVKQAGVSSVKLEGGVRSAARIAAIVAAGIPVMGHIGVLPQTAALTTGFSRRKRRETLMADAHAVEDAGAYAVVLEMVDAEIAGEITADLRIPTIGIGSGGACDGQVLVMHDALGLYPDSPPFAKRYADIGAAATAALRTYAQDVRGRSFPGE